MEIFTTVLEHPMRWSMFWKKHWPTHWLFEDSCAFFVKNAFTPLYLYSRDTSNQNKIPKHISYLIQLIFTEDLNNSVFPVFVSKRPEQVCEYTIYYFWRRRASEHIFLLIIGFKGFESMEFAYSVHEKIKKFKCPPTSTISVSTFS